MDNLLGLTAPAPLSLTALAVNLLLSIVLSTVLAWFYERYGRSLSNRAHFAQTLPLLAMTTVLIISVVKSSLALSLGLVGALSIVRFRTAIKEPEELLYLFMAIAIGLGMGADQRLPTILATAIFVIYLLMRVLVVRRRIASNLYLNVVAPGSDSAFAQIRSVLLEHVPSVDLRRLDHSATDLQATCLIECPDDEVLVRLMDDLRTQIPGCECSFVGQDNALGR
jgi:hypothetical protein